MAKSGLQVNEKTNNVSRAALATHLGCESVKTGARVLVVSSRTKFDGSQ